MTHRPRKRFGQNFLHDRGIIERIIHLINPEPGQQLVEIGPGQGALTAPLLAAAGRLDVVELDRDLIPLLRERFADQGELLIHEGDALKFDFCAIARQKIRVTGNLPYNISTPLLFHLMRHLHCIEDMHFMLQKEVVDRITARPGEKAYGRLGIMLGYYCTSDRLMTIGPGAFNPPPRVDSAIVRLIPHPVPPVTVNDVDHLSRLVAQAFSQRRKTIRNSMKGLLEQTQIEALGIDPGLRPEQLTLAQFAALANHITPIDK
ncbi:MAG: 16S rRNA (adenine(1518)-N(6)/adenine(1519)-N(6))-dimethyltransferase RsmA [Gammaproteobacteria bacterium]|nr:16S rRNA (adenine(1518)-N(6)/adenine(1519)-N(6))-dimethyltransferase RsmA [Gammaproteobacteria bacterium]MDH5652454.1 16S rRNA (adenine(1518)-N(6)/adenine(1519)-N(6))-dimethyltransferase RsmA [Gammaproteobacteria bacterium]